MVNLIVIGGGPAGYVGAIRAAQLGMNVVLIEKETLGGTCLNKGCIPTKSLLHSSSMYKAIQTASTFGISVEGLHYDINKIYARKDEVVHQLVSGIEGLLKANRVKVIAGTAHFLSGSEIEIIETGEKLQADFFLVATGSQVALPPIKGVELALTSDDVLSKPTDASRIAIVGGGVIGVELASHFSNLGRKVVVFENQASIIANMDASLSKQLSLNLKKAGVKLQLKSTVEQIKNLEEGSFQVDFKVKEKLKTADFDLVICCVGRKPYVEGLGLENLNTRERVSFAGDVNNEIQLAHYASAQAIAKVEQIALQESTINLDLVPSCIYTSPELASVGKREIDCTEEVEIGNYPLNGNGKSLISAENKGFVKTIFSKETGKLIGAHICAPHATDMIAELALAIQQELNASAITSIVHAHPTVAEAIVESVASSHSKAIHLFPKI